MSQVELTLHFPYGRPLKKNEKDNLTRNLILGFEAVNIRDAKIKETYYEEKRAMPAIVTLVVIILTAAADIVTIALGIREFLKRHHPEKEIRLQTNGLKLSIKGNMSDEEIIQMVKEARKMLDREKTK